jgi:hypothetical protein
MTHAFLSDPWFDAYRQRVNADAELGAVGEWFSTTFGVTADDARHVLQVVGGQLVSHRPAPRIDGRAVFGFRAPLATWQKFLSPVPPPLHNDFFAMLMRVPEFVLEGDGLVAMQNARALQRMMNLMREA